jgi:hypothetical protein
MAKQVGVKFTGRLGDVVGYRSNMTGKYHLKKVPEFNYQSYKNDEKWANHRKNATEFTTASRYCTAIRRSMFRILSTCCFQGKVKSASLIFLKCLGHDTVNFKGDRVPNLEFLDTYLHNFEWGMLSTFQSVVMRGVDIDTNAATKQHKAIFFRHDSDLDIQQPFGATHYTFGASLTMQADGKDLFVTSQEVLKTHLTQASGYHRIQIGTGQIPRIEIALTEPNGAIGSLRIFTVAVHFWVLENGMFVKFKNGQADAAKTILITSD